MTGSWRDDFEELSDAQAQSRLRQVGAVYQPKVSTQARQVYYAGTINKWVALTRTRVSVLRLTYTDSCPCGG